MTGSPSHRRSKVQSVKVRIIPHTNLCEMWTVHNTFWKNIASENEYITCGQWSRWTLRAVQENKYPIHLFFRSTDIYDVTQEACHHCHVIDTIFKKQITLSQNTSCNNCMFIWACKSVFITSVAGNYTIYRSV